MLLSAVAMTANTQPHGTTMMTQVPNGKPEDASSPEFVDQEEQRPAKRPFQSNTSSDNDDEEQWQKAAKTSDDDSPSSSSRDSDQATEDAEAKWLQVAADVDENLPEVTEATPASTTTTCSLVSSVHTQAEQPHPQAFPFPLPWGMYSPQPACTCAQHHHHHMSSSWQYQYHSVPYQHQAASAIPPSPMAMAMPPVPQQVPVVNGASAPLHAAAAAPPPSPLYSPKPTVPQQQQVVNGASAQRHAAAAPPPTYCSPTAPVPTPQQQVVEGPSGHPQYAVAAPPPYYPPPTYPVQPHLHPHPYYHYYIHAMRQPPPTSPTQSRLPMSMYTASDDEILSDYQIFVRQQIEFFEADVLEVHTAMPGRKKPISLNQIGIRCKHCANVPIPDRKAACAYFPTKVNGLYQAAQNIASTHLAKACPNLSKEHRDVLSAFQSNGKRATAGHGGKHYWADAANVMGIVETPEKGLRFAAARAG